MSRKFGQLVEDEYTSNLMTGIIPNGIEFQEKEGQGEFVKSETLPKTIESTKKHLKKLGFVFGDDYDDLFVNVTFPKGWKKVPTDHSMWSDLLDDKGRLRARIFYKAAFYDRRADITLCCRYSAYYQPVGGWGNKKPEVYEGVVKDSNENIIWTSEPELINEEKRWEAGDASAAKAKKWLKANYPEHDNLFAYWD